MGTVGITVSGDVWNGSGLGHPRIIPNITYAHRGGIGVKPAIIDGKQSSREYPNLTLSVDHDLVDGAPAARFAQRLKELIDRGYGLDLNNRTLASEQTPGPQETHYASHP